MLIITDTSANGRTRAHGSVASQRATGMWARQAATSPIVAMTGEKCALTAGARRVVADVNPSVRPDPLGEVLV